VTRATCIGCAALFALATACRGSSPPGDSPSTGASGAAASAGPTAVPVDHLAPGELLEGSAQAFGITLPQGVRVDEAFVKVVYASGPLPVHPLVQYFRSRLRGGDVREGESSATFDHVTAPSDADRPLSIHIAEVHRGALIEVRDATPAPAPNLPDEAARWKNVGLTPNGRLADPAHFE
jgi:hypothetical protein